ncbi:MAG: hypothetical protein V1753_02030, partial [Pseudomonadota bacterium]
MKKTSVAGLAVTVMFCGALWFMSVAFAGTVTVTSRAELTPGKYDIKVAATNVKNASASTGTVTVKKEGDSIEGEICLDPIILDLNGDIDAINHVIDVETNKDKYATFDIQGNEDPVKVAFPVIPATGSADCFLVRDLNLKETNKPGVVDGAKELFGTQTGGSSGFAMLVAYDSGVGDNVIDWRDKYDDTQSSLEFLKLWEAKTELNDKGKYISKLVEKVVDGKTELVHELIDMVPGKRPVDGKIAEATMKQDQKFKNIVALNLADKEVKKEDSDYEIGTSKAKDVSNFVQEVVDCSGVTEEEMVKATSIIYTPGDTPGCALTVKKVKLELQAVPSSDLTIDNQSGIALPAFETRQVKNIYIEDTIDITDSVQFNDIAGGKSINFSGATAVAALAADNKPVTLDLSSMSAWDVESTEKTKDISSESIASAEKMPIPQLNYTYIARKYYDVLLDVPTEGKIDGDSMSLTNAQTSFKNVSSSFGKYQIDPGTKPGEYKIAVADNSQISNFANIRNTGGSLLAAPVLGGP